MADSTTESRKLQWTWVGISFLMYAVFYLLPLWLSVGVFTVSRGSLIFAGVWAFGGLIVIAAVAGFLSKGVTIWEPAIAGVGLVLAWYLAFRFLLLPRSYTHYGSVAGVSAILLFVFLLSLAGAGLGELLQKIWKEKSSEST